MYFSAPYLALTHPRLETHFVSQGTDSLEAVEAIHFVPNYALPELPGAGLFDLVINTLSMSEFSPHQVNTYGMLISRLIGGEGLFFEQNLDNRWNKMINCKDYLPRHFLRRTEIRPTFTLTQGIVDVWSNRSIRLPYERS